MPTRSWSRRGPLLLALASAAAFVLLSGLVAVGATQRLDDRVRQLFRPHDIWSTNQLLFGNVVDILGPPVSVGLLLLAGIVSAARARTLRPVAYAALLAAAAAVLAAACKVIVRRPDPDGAMSTIGAFPSGHMLILLVSWGGAVLVLRRSPRWWEWCIVAMVGVTMAASLLFVALHLFTDVVGSVLLAVTILALASMAGLRDPAGSRDRTL